VIKKTILWTAVTAFTLGIALFFLIYQEYKPVHASELIMESVRSPDLVGDFIYPSKKSRLPVVVFLGGSGGGMGNETEMKSLAMEGYAVFSLENIPLEYFENAFGWLNTRSQVDTSKIILLGVSRGAELALLLGSVYPQVKGVIAYSPSCFVLPNATEIEKDASLTASWTVKGDPVPFVPIKRFDENGDKPINYRTYIEPLLSQNNTFEEFMIKAENINGPVLLISGAQDAVWPASEMAGRIEDRLKKKGFKQELTNTIFEDGGHDVFMMKDCIPVVSGITFKKIRLTIRGEQYSFNLGGTTMGVIDSKIQSRKIALHFLDAFKSAN
jgi:uncharacterized protein